MVIFTKFDAQIIQESVKLTNMENHDKWVMARENADITFQSIYLASVLSTLFFFFRIEWCILALANMREYKANS